MNFSLFSPDYSPLTGLLRLLNEAELKELFASEDKQMALIHDLKQVQDIEAEREMLLTRNKSLSEYNLSQQPLLEDHRRQLKETHKIALDLKNCLLNKKQNIASKEGTQSPETLLALLQAAAAEVDSEAEAIVDQFLTSEISVDGFLEKYLDTRKLAHLRRIKSEKFVCLLNGDESNFNIPPVRPQRLRKPPSPPLPYPPAVAQNNVPIAPVRQAPNPPYRMPYPNPYQPNPYGSVPQFMNYQSASGYQQPQNYPRYR